MTDKTPIRRRLAAIVAADIAGYSRLMGEDEAATVHDLKGHQAAVLPLVARHGGRIIDTAGDGILAEFPSIIDASACALEIQAVMAARNEPVPEGRRMRFRMGINLGDVIFDDSRIYGDGINVAARLEGLAEPGDILVSHAVYEQVRHRLEAGFDDLGEQSLKNIARPVRVYRLRTGPDLVDDSPPARATAFSTAGSASTRTVGAASQAPLRAPAEAQPPLTPALDDKSIAVLAFVDRSPQKDHEYFSDGISEELLNLLAKITQLKVIARTSSFSFKGKDVSIAEIARQLNVAHILEGSVRKAGNKVRVTAQLIRAADSAHLWSETYDRTLDDIFAMQDEIAAKVVEQLRIRLLGAAPKAIETSPEAYALYLQARQISRQSSAASYTRALALLDQVLAIDPGYAPAWTLKCAVYGQQTGSGLTAADAGWQQAREAANRALALDPEDGIVHARTGWIAMMADRDLPEAARHFTRALSLAPADPVVLRGAAALLTTLGRSQPSLVLEEWAASRDPANPVAHGNLGFSYRCAGHLELALASLRTALGLSPTALGRQFAIACVLRQLGRPEEALTAAQQEPGDMWRLCAVAMVLHDLGRTEESDAALAEAIDRHAQEAAYNIAGVLACRGEADRAFEWLDKAVEYRDAGLSEIVLDPDFAGLRGDPRWPAFLRRIGMAPEQLDAIPFEVDLPA